MASVEHNKSNSALVDSSSQDIADHQTAPTNKSLQAHLALDPTDPMVFPNISNETFDNLERDRAVLIDSTKIQQLQIIYRQLQLWIVSFLEYRLWFRFLTIFPEFSHNFH